MSHNPKYIPFRYRKKTKEICDFIHNLNPDQHYLNCHRVEANWFITEHVWINVYCDSSSYYWNIMRIFGKGSFGRCKTMKEFKEKILELLSKREELLNVNKS